MLGAHVVLSDQPCALRLLQKNADTNAQSRASACRVQVLRWGNKDDARAVLQTLTSNFSGSGAGGGRDDGKNGVGASTSVPSFDVVVISDCVHWYWLDLSIACSVFFLGLGARKQFWISSMLLDHLI